MYELITQHAVALAGVVLTLLIVGVYYCAGVLDKKIKELLDAEDAESTYSDYSTDESE